ncbi:pyridoxamine 5'-phosphate oxidase [Streptomyces qinglanensis]|uniref:Pyridoxamine 5'-phosphate oxidase n=2 Tax=Streptomyces TaxID=1883 RepID=A0A1E7K0F6_9ACTN|nr:MULTISPECIES: PPOX class F420-dependent oxidoreductase [Streptomyces]MBE9498666.1 PPOX class F420-dependent oxidoreductase [Streptomyces sp. GKU 257-1]OEU97390.1 pyridoxamine 5'-phosphate oxidase [Streptomyces qinglanensis]OEV11539.1 pyridoxamine 5'-phosphate oxidase [Streptomyces nanshensis]
MQRMTEAQWQDFVLTGTRTGKLATTRKDGRPHVTPVWFLLDDAGRLLFTVDSASLKYRSLRRDPRFSLCVDDQEPPYSFVMLECVAAEFLDDLELMRSWATRLGSRYMGAERADEYGRRNAVPGEYLVRARVERAVAFAGIAD